MKQTALKFYVCPDCRASLALEIRRISGNEIVAGTLNCSCGKHFEIVNGIPRFVATMGGIQQGTADDYGLQWTKLLEGNLEDGTVYGVARNDWVNYFQTSTGLRLAQLHGKRILDAGCGSGKLVRALHDCGSQIVSLDIHNGLDAVYVKAGEFPCSHIVQGDASNSPMAANTFDLVWSSGMIHRTPEPRKVFEHLATLVAEDGLFFVWVCRTRRNPYRMIRNALPFARKLPAKLMYCLALLLAIPLWVLFTSIYAFGKVLGGTKLFGFKQSKNRYRHYGEIALTVFDIVGPDYLHHFSEGEIMQWFESAGFHELQSTDSVDIGICGRKQCAK